MSGFREFAQNLWIVEGPKVRDFGVMFTTRMTIAKLSDGSIWINSPVSVSFSTLQRIIELGPVHYLIAATPRHVWRLEQWHRLFPEAQLWVTKNSLLTLRKRSLQMNGILGDRPPSDWADVLDQLAFKGNPLIEEVLFFHQASRTVIMDDLIQTHPVVQGKPLRNILFKLFGVSNGGVPFDIRLSFIHRNLAKRSMEKLLSWDFDKLIIAHGPCIEKNAKPFVERAFRWIMR